MAYTITVKTTFEVEGESDGVEVSYPCEYVYSQNEQIIRYNEQTEDGEVPTCVTVQPNSVDIVRDTPAMPDMHMMLGQTVESVIQTPYGDIPMTSTTRGVHCDMNEDGGCVRLLYTIDIGGNISNNTVCITVSKCGEC